MKIIILSLAFFSVLNWAYAQPGSITNIQVSQGAGVNERVLDIQFDLTGSDAAYDISLEVSFDNGGTYLPIDPNEVTGASNVVPGNGIPLIWDGRISYAGYSTDIARIKIIATGIWQCGNPITDSRDGQSYNTVLIGTQCWMKENLNVGTMINESQEMSDNETIEKYCYNNDPANCSTYGGLYQWNEIMQYTTTPGTQGICPDGWHIPMDEEWTALTNYLGGASVAGGKMKEAGFVHWYPPNTGATNESGFTALPGGYRPTGGSFDYLGTHGHWWSSTDYSGSTAWHRYLGYTDAGARRYYYYKTYGFSLRCLQD
ncbi:MAG: hypothetical protein M0Q51_12910 [Bacteroidales bacterium]|nr:hypothetical protein [Bacteroidales bacterium]